MTATSMEKWNQQSDRNVQGLQGAVVEGVHPGRGAALEHDTDVPLHADLAGADVAAMQAPL